MSQQRTGQPQPGKGANQSPERRPEGRPGDQKGNQRPGQPQQRDKDRGGRGQ
jgi:hypothetical protein